MDTLKAQSPYMPQEVIDWLDKTLRKDMRVFEWGSGGSTLFIASRVRSVVSIEYGRRWFLKVLLALASHLVLNCRLKLVLPEEKSQQSEETEPYRSSGKYGHLTFKKYVEVIDSYPDGYFDVIVIDGRCRVRCLAHAQAKVKKGGYILLDDVADRPNYAAAVSGIRGFSVEPVNRARILRRE